jgi:hypothetical protein
MMMMNERSTLLSSASDKEQSRPSAPTTTVWKAAAASFLAGVLATLLVVAMTTTTSTRLDDSTNLNDVPMLGKKHKKTSAPALHFFKNASTDFVSTLPPLPPNIDDSFLADLATR